jgi:hypothetical protein
LGSARHVAASLAAEVTPDNVASIARPVRRNTTDLQIDDPAWLDYARHDS